MSIKVVDPIEVTEAVLTASGIPEPDASVGEGLWQDRTQTIPFSGFVGTKHASVSVGNFVYIVGDYGSVLKFDVLNQSLSSFGSHAGTMFSIVHAGGDFLYAAGNSGSALKIDIVNSTTSTIGSGIQNLSCLHYHTNGFIYGLGDGNPTTNGEVVKIDVSTDSITTFGTYDSLRLGVAGYSDQYLYSVGGSIDVLKIDVVNETISTITSQTVNLQDIARGTDGNMYCVGDSTVVTKINTSSDTFSYFGTLSTGMRDLSAVGSKFYACGLAGVIYEIDYLNNLTSVYRETTEPLRTLSTNGLYTVAAGTNENVILVDRGYVKDEEVILTDTHRRYRCLVNETFSNPKDTATGDATAEWLDIGPTNKWAMFDDRTTSKSSAATDFTVTLEPVNYVNTIGFLRTENVDSVLVVVKDSGGNVVYTKEGDLLDVSAIYDYYTFFFYQSVKKDQYIDDELPPYLNPTIEVTFKGTNMKVGELVVGFANVIGHTIADTESRYLNLSRRTFDEFGELEIVKRPSVKLNKYEVLADKSRNPYIQRIIERLDDKNTLWIADIGSDQKLITYGTYEKSPIPYNMPDHVRYSITVRGSI